MIRYQTFKVTIPRGTNSVTEQQVELYRDMPTLSGIGVVLLNDASKQLVQLAIADRVKDLVDPIPVHFFKTPYTYYLPVHTEAGGNNLFIRRIAENATHSDTNLLVVCQLTDEEMKPAKPFRFFYHRLQVPQLSNGTVWKSPLVNLPTEYKYVSGMWVTVRMRKGGSIGGVLSPVALGLGIKDITGMPQLDTVPVDLLSRDGAGYNHNRRFYPVNFKAGGSINIELTAFGSVLESYVDVVMLLSNHKLEL